MNNIERIVSELTTAGIGSDTVGVIVDIVDAIVTDASVSSYWEGFIAGREVAA